MAHTFKPRTREAQAGGSPELETSPIYRASSKMATITQRIPISKKKTKKQKNKKKPKLEVLLFIKVDFNSCQFEKFSNNTFISET